MPNIEENELVGRNLKSLFAVLEKDNNIIFYHDVPLDLKIDSLANQFIRANSTFKREIGLDAIKTWIDGYFFLKFFLPNKQSLINELTKINPFYNISIFSFIGSNEKINIAFDHQTKNIEVTHETKYIFSLDYDDQILSSLKTDNSFEDFLVNAKQFAHNRIKSKIDENYGYNLRNLISEIYNKFASEFEVISIISEYENKSFWKDLLLLIISFNHPTSDIRNKQYSTYLFPAHMNNKIEETSLAFSVFRRDNNYSDENIKCLAAYCSCLDTSKNVISILKVNLLKTAIISILIDSYAHNISAHSLAALKWWIEQRHKMLDKRFSVPVKPNKHGLFPLYSPKLETITLDKTKDSTKKYYEALGLTDSSYDKGFYSLYDFLQFADSETTYKLLSFTEKVELLSKDSRTKISFNPRFPVPIDYALFPFFRFLRDKGAFWSGVTRDVANGGETKTWYKILWEDFANNPLYLGTIAKSEGISKININLAIKSNGTWHHGRFVTIDMSVIDYEEKLIASSNLELSNKNNERNKLLKIEHKEETHCKEEECVCEKINHNLKSEERCHHSNNGDTYVEPDSYSKYAFVRLGKCFAHFRDILDKEEFNVFLPGGIVGEHALFTIFENTIRNIKHYKNDINNIANDGIDFWISIEKAKLKIAKDSNSLYKVAVWLGHETDLGNKKEKEGKFNWDDVLIKKVTDSTLLSILDDNGAPRMGGNSQDKACAAMLFNNEFKSVERKDNEKEAHYYPWITFSTSFKEKPFNNYYLDNGENEPYVRLNDAGKKNDYVKEYLNQIGINEEVKQKSGLLKKHFHLWQGADYLEVTDIKQLEGENISRFKFAVVNINDVQKRNEIILQLRKYGIIRILEDILIDDRDGKTGKKKEIENIVNKEFEVNKNDQEFIKKFVTVEKETNRRLLEFLYSEWLKIWITKNKYFLILGENWSSLKYQNNDCVRYLFKPTDLINLNDYPNEIKTNINLSHGGKEEENNCNVRSHGYFWTKFFAHIKNKQPDSIGEEFHEEKLHFLYELFEILVTRIFIYDNRLHDRFNKLPEDKQKMFRTNLLLDINLELFDNKTFENELKNKIIPNGLPAVLIIHLSLIENLGFSEKNISEFVTKYLEVFISSDQNKDHKNFIFVVTTGRGRDVWRTSLEKDSKLNFILHKTIFKPVESLLTAVESGISYNDNFDVKYNLIKVIFGS